MRTISQVVVLFLAVVASKSYLKEAYNSSLGLLLVAIPSEVPKALAEIAEPGRLGGFEDGRCRGCLQPSTDLVCLGRVDLNPGHTRLSERGGPGRRRQHHLAAGDGVSVIVREGAASIGSGDVGSSRLRSSEARDGVKPDEANKSPSLGSLLTLISGQQSRGDMFGGKGLGPKGVFQGCLNPADESVISLHSDGRCGRKRIRDSSVLGRGSIVESTSESLSADGKNVGNKFLQLGTTDSTFNDGRGGQSPC
jgi:hypothetical protein